jgi:hypothetical protein
MAAVRSWHPVRLALVCAVLAMAGSAPAARANYAEVSARAVAAVRLEAEREAAQPVVETALPARARIALAVTRPVAPALVAAPLYLAHCSLLL